MEDDEWEELGGIVLQRGGRRARVEKEKRVDLSHPENVLSFCLV